MKKEKPSLYQEIQKILKTMMYFMMFIQVKITKITV